VIEAGRCGNLGGSSGEGWDGFALGSAKDVGWGLGVVVFVMGFVALLCGALDA
jgi:hypothetical protein